METLPAQRMERESRADELTGIGVPLVATAIAHSQTMPEEMRALIKPHLAGLMETIIAGAKRGNRTCRNGIIKIALHSSASEDLLAALAAAIGAHSVVHMRQAAVAALDAEHVDEATLWAQAEEHAQRYRREHGLPALVEAGVGPGERG